MRLTITVTTALAGLLLGTADVPAAPHPEASRTVVVASETVPEGLEVARHYMAARGIPRENLCVVSAPAGETITREEFDETLWQPLLAFLARWGGRLDVALPDGTVELRIDDRRPKYLVPVYGVPVKVSGYEDVKTMYMSRAAAVDSELALLPGRKHKLVGGLPNPYFGAAVPFGPPLDEQMVLVSRLDGPTPAIARRLVDDAVWAEANGLKGRAYIDTRGLTKGAYAPGDNTLRFAAKMLQQVGFQTEVDERPEVLPLAHPMPDPAIYLGWYHESAAGPMTKPDFRFNRGAVAYHLQSFSGADIRDPKAHWVGPLLAAGACVTAGAVYEPFLHGTPRVDILVDRLLRGHSWGEAAYMSQAQVSWQMCFVGDPLYRPFVRGR
ncbi:MAG TPA: TIGR03790 family protein, partial [Phycisphaerae bacterium]|nr:TIGR03790 family protein [Phycisphaerae bacterium]